MPNSFSVAAIPAPLATAVVVEHHYLHRRPHLAHCFGLFSDEQLVGVCVFGCPASRQVQSGACPDDPDCVIELNRLWVSDDQPANTASWFVSRCLRAMPPRIVVSYADTAAGHDGYVYRALNFHYAGWTDMDRATARYDYLVPGKHTRDAFRGGSAAWTTRVRRLPKARYWTTTGDRRERRALAAACRWPCMSWNEHPVPHEHTRLPTCSLST